MANSNEGQDHKDKYFDTSRKILSQEMTMCNMEALVSYFSEVMTNVNFFLNWSKLKIKRLSTGLQKDLITRDIHVKYHSSNTHYSKVISKVKVLKKMGQTPRSRSQGKK